MTLKPGESLGEVDPETLDALRTTLSKSRLPPKAKSAHPMTASAEIGCVAVGCSLQWGWGWSVAVCGHAAQVPAGSQCRTSVCKVCRARAAALPQLGLGSQPRRRPHERRAQVPQQVHRNQVLGKLHFHDRHNTLPPHRGPQVTPALPWAAVCRLYQCLRSHPVAIPVCVCVVAVRAKRGLCCIVCTYQRCV